MKKFINSNIWNFGSNTIVRLLSILIYPILVNYYSKQDISLFKSFQSFILIIIMVIPFGSNYLFISSDIKFKDNRWPVFFYFSIIFGIFLALLFPFIKPAVNFFFPDLYSPVIALLFGFVIMVVTIKIIYLTKLISKLDFKEISISLLIKQLVLYFAIILFSFLKPSLTFLLISVIFAEIIEVLLLIYFVKKKNYNILPISKKKVFPLDAVSRKTIFFIGFDQIFNVMAIHAPAIIVVLIMGAEIAPEFQLPLYAVGVPVSLIMSSLIRTIFPYLSEIRENKLIRPVMLKITYLLTFIMLPLLISIYFFSEEIVSVLFNKSWLNAVIAFKILSLMMIANIMNNPFTSLAVIKEKPHINLTYSFLLLIGRLMAIYFGYKYYQFIGAISFFAVTDIIIRFIRLSIDLRLIELRIKDYLKNIRYNFIGILIMVLINLFFSNLLGSKVISFIIAIIAYIVFTFSIEKNRIIFFIKEIKSSI